jgi:hypothetical protein
MTPPQQIEMGEQFELPTRAGRGPDEGVFDDRFGFWSEACLDRRVA